jgi:putative transposase
VARSAVRSAERHLGRAVDPNKVWVIGDTPLDISCARAVGAKAVAVGRRGAVAGVIAHSDRGSRYASEHDQAELARHQMVGGMSGVGQCWENAVIESTFGRLKVELVHHQTGATRDEATASTVGYIEVLYNRVRRHSTLEYMTPDEFERTHNPDCR